MDKVELLKQLQELKSPAADAAIDRLEELWASTSILREKISEAEKLPFAIIRRMMKNIDATMPPAAETMMAVLLEMQDSLSDIVASDIAVTANAAEQHDRTRAILSAHDEESLCDAAGRVLASEKKQRQRADDSTEVAHMLTDLLHDARDALRGEGDPEMDGYAVASAIDEAFWAIGEEPDPLFLGGEDA